MIKEYIVKTAVELNSKYPGILNEEQVARAIIIFQNSGKEYDEMVSEIEVIKEKMIKEYIARNNKTNENDRNSRTFSQIRKTQLKVQELLDKNGLTIYIAGGSVPYLLKNEDSGRLHDDIDTVCRKEDIEKLRKVFIEAGLYNPNWDSKNFSEDGKDYGFEMKIDGVPYGIFPFEYDEESKTLTQYSADPYIKSCKVKTIPLQEISDYIMTYKGADGKNYDTMSLEYIKLTKDNAGRQKDIVDSKKIEETGLLRPEVLNRVKMYTEYVNGEKKDSNSEMHV